MYIIESHLKAEQPLMQILDCTVTPLDRVDTIQKSNKKINQTSAYLYQLLHFSFPPSFLVSTLISRFMGR